MALAGPNGQGVCCPSSKLFAWMPNYYPPAGRVAVVSQSGNVQGMLIGGVTVFALPPEIPLYVDEELMGLDHVILGAGSRSAKIKAPPEILRRIPNSRVISGLSLAPDA